MQRMRDDGEAARRNPLGFYHGTLVKCGPLEFVMQGPEVRFLRRRPASADETRRWWLSPARGSAQWAL
jgi:hypothetical protein